ncbi:dephospho-CoA kinase [Deinococcus sp.]|uniref:dephospho-CoA kinase n=1 Tax=Deinococcus sp. TaxID=47478 RepID=UPI0025C2879A|nr:dephospho-CoA kinase [Deinococcus sp.]
MNTPSSRIHHLSPHRLGLTGSIGAGKSTVAALLRERGLTVLDADAEARKVTEEPQTLAQIETAFPGTVKEGVLDRSALAAAAFADPERTQILNTITHPRVRARMADLEAEAVARGATWVVQDIPLLFESGQEKNFDAVLLVNAPLEVRIGRVMARSNLSREDILARDARQLPAAEKRQRATVTLENGGDLAELEQQLDTALLQLGVKAPALNPG